jgi:superfamily II DNA or RNA helicase
MKLRAYQEEALRISKQKWNAGVTRQLLALPTGTGKTCIFASLPQQHKINKSMLILVHRSELANQAFDKIHSWNPDLRMRHVGIEMGFYKCTGWEKVVIAGVQTVGRDDSKRLLKFPANYFDVIVCDEAHHSSAHTYLNVFDHFGLFDRDNEKLLLGVTATPFRADDKKLVPGVYQEIIYNMPMLQAIEQGWLCDVRGFRITGTDTNLDSVMVLGDDFAEYYLGLAVNNRVRNGLIAKEWQKLAGARRTIVFAVTVEHAIQLAAAFRDYCGVKADAVWGEDPEREGKLEAHLKGRLQVLCNCAVLTEGYDDWGIECIVMARPTLSKGLFVQMIGRGTRIEDFEDGISLVQARQRGLPISKAECIVIDVVDNTTKHDLVTLASLFNSGIDFRGKSLSEAAKQAKPGAVAIPSLTSTEIQKVDRIPTWVKEVDLFRGAKRQYSWGVNRHGTFEVQVEPPGSGCVKYWEDSPGCWRVMGTIDGASFELGATFTKTEAELKAQELASRRIGAPRVTGRVERRPKPRARPVAPPRTARRAHRAQVWESISPDVQAQKRESPDGYARCPYCKQPVREGRLRKHMTTKCPERPKETHPEFS